MDATRVRSLAWYWPSNCCHSPIQAWTGRTILSWATQFDACFCGFVAWRILRLWRWKRYVSLKHWLLWTTRRCNPHRHLSSHLFRPYVVTAVDPVSLKYEHSPKRHDSVYSVVAIVLYSVQFSSQIPRLSPESESEQRRSLYTVQSHNLAGEVA